MSDDDFESEKQSLITHKLEKPKQLIGYSKRLWSEIDSKQYNFNRDEIEVNVIRTLKKDDITAFFKKHLIHDSPNRKKLSVSIMNTNAGNEVDVKEDSSNVKEGLFPAPTLKEPIKIENMTLFRNGLALYSLPQPVIDVYQIEKSKL